MWSVANESIARPIPLLDGYVVERLALSPNAQYVGVVERGGRALMWEVSSQEVTELTIKDAQSLTFSPLGKWLSDMTRTGAQVWDMTTSRSCKMCHCLLRTMDPQHSALTISI